MHAERVIALGLTALLVFSSPALAAQTVGKAPMRYSALLELQRGALLIDDTLNAVPEMRPTAPETGVTTLKFTDVDADANGKVTKEEFEKQGLTESLFTTIDTDHDGTVSQGEMDSHGPLTKAVQ